MYISTPPSSDVENFQMKIYYPTGDQTPDLLNKRQTCYHLSQHSELKGIYVGIKSYVWRGGTKMFKSATALRL